MHKLLKLITALFFITTIGITGSEAEMKGLIKESTLKNGLKVLVKPVTTAPVVSVFVWYKVGSRNEPAGQSGLAHFLEHMLFKGTKKFGKGEIARLIARTGGQQNAFTSYDYTAYYETVPKEHLQLALEIEADRMRHALISAKEVAAEKTVILSELDGNRNHPQVRLRELVNAHTWIHHPYRRPVIGWKKEVENLSTEQLRSFYDNYYQPNNATLVIVGDVTEQAVMRLVRKTFGPIPKGNQMPEVLVSDELGATQKRVTLVDDAPTKICRINIPIPQANHQDHFALTVLNDVLVRGKTSRLYRALVDKGLATNVSGGAYEMVDPGYWTFNINATPNATVEQIESALLTTFQNIQKQQLKQREFQQAVNQTKAEFIYAKDSLTDQAMMLGFYETVAGDYRLLDRYPEKVAAVTKQAIQQAAKKYLDQDNMTIGWLIPNQPNQGGRLAPVRDNGHMANLWARPNNRQDIMGLPGASQAGDGHHQPAFVETATRKQLILKNGLTVILQKNPSNPMVVVSGIVDAGVIHEPADAPGLAMLHARLLDKGNRYQQAEQIASALEFKGVALSFQAQLEHLSIHGEALSDDFGLLIKTMAQCLSTPTFVTSEIKKAAKKLAAQSQISEDNAMLQAWQGFYRLAYPKGHPMQRSLLDIKTSVTGITQQQLKSYHRTKIIPNQTIISLSGDFEFEEAKRIIQQSFQSWAPHSQSQAVASAMEPVKQTATTIKVMPSKHESMVVMGHEGIHRLDPDYYHLFVANQILGGSTLSSRLMKVVRDQHGLTYSIYSYLKLSKSIRPWCVVFQADPNKIEKAILLTKQEIQALQDKKLTTALLDDAKQELTGRLVLNLETNSGLAYLNREIAYHQLGWNYLQTYPAAINEVTYQKMISAAKHYLHPDRLLISVAGPKKNQTDLK